jgi:hypothetical protein
MIRRDDTAPDGSRSWIRISQVDHARISGELATHWGANGFTPIEPREELLPAIFGHDNGWAAWEQFPGVDPQLGRPLNFTEMPLADSLAIWQRSIDSVASYGDLAGYVVSGHFSALLRHANHWQKMGTDHRADAADFLARQDAFRAQSLALWQSRHPASDAPAVAAYGLRCLQFFDALSLWFCTAQRDRPHTLEPPGGPFLTFIPGSPTEIGLAPWPLDQAELTVATAGRQIPGARYASSEELAAVQGATVRLVWRLTPAE